MSEFKGTKGKWLAIDKPSNGLVKEEDAFAILTFDDEWDVCAVWKDCQDIEISKANALLISKAPEMLEMIEELLKELSFHGYNNSTTIYNAKQLIKEATEL